MESEKKVLVDVDIKATQALKELAELRIKADELKKAQKELDRTTDEGRQQYEALGQQIKALNTVANERQKTIQSEIKTQNEQKGLTEKQRRWRCMNKEKKREVNKFYKPLLLCRRWRGRVVIDARCGKQVA